MSESLHQQPVPPDFESLLRQGNIDAVVEQFKKLGSFAQKRQLRLWAQDLHQAILAAHPEYAGRQPIKLPDNARMGMIASIAQTLRNKQNFGNAMFFTEHINPEQGMFTGADEFSFSIDRRPHSMSLMAGLTTDLDAVLIDTKTNQHVAEFGWDTEESPKINTFTLINKHRLIDPVLRGRGLSGEIERIVVESARGANLDMLGFRAGNHEGLLWALGHNYVPRDQQTMESVVRILAKLKHENNPTMIEQSEPHKDDLELFKKIKS